MKPIHLETVRSVRALGKYTDILSIADGFSLKQASEGFEVSYEGGMTLVPWNNVRFVQYVETPAPKKK
jgi:hypothetical protein